MKRITQLQSSKRINKNTKRNWTTSCLLEAMECRCLMSGTPLPVGISMAGGVVSIVGGDGEDMAGVKMVNGQVQVTLSHIVQGPSIDINTPPVKFKMTDPIKTFNPAQVSRIDFLGGAGNDSFVDDTPIACRAFGYTGDDVLIGGSGNDQLYGGADADQLQGRGGNDLLTGNGGNDAYLFPGTNLGADSVVESANVDEDTLDFTGFGIAQPAVPGLLPISTFPSASLQISPVVGPVYGPVFKSTTLDLALTSQQIVCAGNLILTLSDGTGIEDVTGSGFSDNIKGNARNNMIDGQGGADLIDGRGGADYLYGGASNDVIHGGDGSDNIWGGNGNDILFADFGNDKLNGEANNDTLYASPTDATSLYGGSGDDTLMSVGGSKYDKQFGGTGFDSFWLDSAATETTDADAGEIAAGHVHRIGSFFACQIDKGNGNVLQLGAPGLTRNGMTLADPMTKSPSVGYSDFRANPLFSSAGPSKNDIMQGTPIGDCYFMTLMAAIARNHPDHIRQTVADLGDGTYAVDFKDNSNKDVYVRVDGDLPTSGGLLAYAKLGKGNSMWVPIIEKAWTFYRDEKPAGQGSVANAGQGTYASIEYWHPEYTHSPYSAFNTPAVEKVVSTLWDGNSNLSSGKEFLKEMKAAMDLGLAVTLSGPHPLDQTTAMVAANKHSGAHAYLVDWISNDFTQIRIRNPYATQGPNGDGYTTITADRAFYCCYDFTTLVV